MRYPPLTANTHTNPDLLRENTDKYIKEHIIYGCPVIGIGGMPTEYRGTLEGTKAFIKNFSDVAKKINDAGRGKENKRRRTCLRVSQPRI